MGRLFDISELEANIFSEDELREIDTIAHETNASEEMAMEHEFHEKDAMEWFSENDFTGDETDDFPALELELTLEDGQSLMCEVACVFLVGERVYGSPSEG